MEVGFGGLCEFGLVNVLDAHVDDGFALDFIVFALEGGLVETLGGFVLGTVEFVLGILEGVLNVADLLEQPEVGFGGESLSIVGTVERWFCGEVVEFGILGLGLDFFGVRSFSVDLHNSN